MSVVLGAAFVQYITQKHVHILHKWNLARDYIVQDLASAEPPSHSLSQPLRRGNEDRMGIELPFQRYGESTKSSDGDVEEEQESMLRGDSEDPFRASGRSLNPMQFHETSSSIVNRRERSSAPPLSVIHSHFPSCFFLLCSAFLLVIIIVMLSAFAVYSFILRAIIKVINC